MGVFQRKCDETRTDTQNQQSHYIVSVLGLEFKISSDRAKPFQPQKHSGFARSYSRDKKKSYSKRDGIVILFNHSFIQKSKGECFYCAFWRGECLKQTLGELRGVVRESSLKGWLQVMLIMSWLGPAEVIL